MVPGAWRTGLNSAGFIRLLAELTAIDLPGPQPSFAERLGAWLDWTDAIPLSAVLNAPAPNATPARPAPDRAAEACRRVRTDLSRAITTDALFAAAPADVDDFQPYRQAHAAHQRAMAARIRTLRAELRATLAGTSPALGRLAALDAVMDEILGPRERSLLSTVPALLERRFDQLRQAQPPGPWQAGFGKTLQALLLAELALRLQPVEGLLAALDPDSHGPTGPRRARPAPAAPAAQEAP